MYRTAKKRLPCQNYWRTDVFSYARGRMFTRRARILRIGNRSELLREQLIKEVEENLEKAIAAARRASMTEEDVIRLLRLLMEVNDE